MAKSPPSLKLCLSIPIYDSLPYIGVDKSLSMPKVAGKALFFVIPTLGVSLIFYPAAFGNAELTL